MKYKQGIVILALSWIGVVYSAIYTWTDSRGVVHFSDQPSAGSKEVQLPQDPAPTSRSALPSLASDSRSAASTVKPINEKAAEKGVLYESITILEPKDNDTIRNPQGFIPVTVEVKPALQTGDMLQLLLDGNVMGPPQAMRSFSLTGLERGEHTIQVQAVNLSGKELISSDKVTVFLMPPRVDMGTPVKGGRQ